MKISRNWLQTYVDLSGLSNDEISRAITLLGFEVEGVHTTGAPQLDNVFVGEVLTRDKHPNADKLSVCNVDVGPTQGVKRIVCGAQNYKVGDRVPVALVGAVLPGNFVIKQSKIRGESSDGMMCSAKELGVAEDAAGLLILPGRPELGTPINAVLPPGDTIFDIEITPNRPDCLSHLGIARELSAWFKKDLAYPEVHFTPEHAEPAPRADLLKLVEVDSPENCPLYTATVIAGVKIGPSPEWLQQRLLAVGLRPINNVVDVGNFVTLEYGQPVHAFDAKKLAGHSILVRQAVDGEKIVTLDGKTRTLTERMLVIADAEKPVVIAGLMGGENSGVSDDTTDLVLEVAIFKRQAVRWTSRRLGLSSDSSYRYERGVDPHSLEEAMHRCIDLILQTAGGKVMGPTYKVGHDVPWQREIVITPAYINERLGFEIPAAEMKASLEALELTVVREDETDGRGPAWTVNIPSWRDDLDRPIDLVEEVLRVYGSDKIPATVVMSPGLLVDDDVIVAFNRAVTDALVGQSFNECVTYTLRPLKETSAAAPAPAVPGLALANPFLEDQSHLRATLIPGLLESLKLNQDRGVAATRLFETGRVFLERNGQTWECAAVGFVICDNEKERGTWLRRAPADFYTAKRLTEIVAAAAGVELARQPVASVAAPGYGWQEGHAAGAGELAHGWTARFGLLDVAQVKALGVEGKVYAGFFAILPEKLPAATARGRYQPFSLQPAALRDLAVVVDAATPAADVQKSLAKLARAAAGNAFALESVNVFDVYQGAGLPEGKKSLAFSLVFRSPDRTLTDDEVNAAFTKLQDELVKTTSWQIRK
ncbi:MAG TPA: phenylalanine--tRNA ligase subunit beta [Opitutaceae bacterium]